MEAALPLRPRPPPPVDTIVANHYVAAWPGSGFRKILMVSRAAPDGRHTLLNDKLSFHRLGGESDNAGWPMRRR